VRRVARLQLLLWRAVCFFLGPLNRRPARRRRWSTCWAPSRRLPSHPPPCMARWRGRH